MDTPLGGPAPATVVAINLQSTRPGRSLEQVARQTFTQLISAALAHSCHIQPADSQNGEMNLALIIPDTSQALTILRRLFGVQTDINVRHPESSARFIVHHGIVFPSNNAYIGSSLRHAHAKLGRLPSPIDHAATSDFVSFTKPWAAHHISFAPFAEAGVDPALLNFSLASPAAPKEAGRPPIDAAFVRHLSHCLATHMGPFASVMVEAAQRTSHTSQQLLEELANEIDDPQAKANFIDEVRAAFPLTGQAGQ